MEINDKPFIKRGVLSVINSLYDPLGFAAPVSMEGRSILREFFKDISEWDSPLPKEQQDKCQEWKDSLKHLGQLKNSGMYASHCPKHRERKCMSFVTHTPRQSGLSLT